MNNLNFPSIKSVVSGKGAEAHAGGRRKSSDESHHSDLETKQATIEDNYHTEDLHLHYPRKRRSWHNRPKSPGLKWHNEYNSATLKCGRVLVIDYVKQDLTTEGKRKVTSQEIANIETLKKIYYNPARGGEALCRLIHVQNAPWAVEFLLRKFNINAQDDLVGLDFDRYLRHRRPERRGRKSAVSGKTWQTQHDPWRGVSKTAFGIDYFKQYLAPDTIDRVTPGSKGKFMELNCFDHDDNPCYGWDVYVQRLSCYVQHKEDALDIGDGNPDIQNPYKQTPGADNSRNQYHSPRLEDLDNGNAILIFDESQSGSIVDTMIPARRKMESRWRRLPFYMVFEQAEAMDDDQLGLECVRLIAQDVWKAAAETWESFLDVSSGHVGILEDRVYENPADESLAPLLWTNSDMWLSVERLMLVHINVIRESQFNLKEIADRLDVWFESAPREFERLNSLIQEDLIKPTAALADLLYKSVGIRDARHAVELSISLWRLSWITFIFLPLTFLCGFFSMQVDLFANTVSLRWYFVAALPMMLAVIVSWLVLKQFLDGARQSPYARGIYEHLFQDLATTYPTLWTRTGPRYTVRPTSKWARMKWWLIHYWSAPERTTNVGPINDDSLFDGLGAWSRFKRQLIRQWTLQIQASTMQRPLSSPESGSTGSTSDDLKMSSHFVGQAINTETVDTEALQVPFDMNKRISMTVDEPRRPHSKSSSGGRNSGVMVEEERLDWLENP